jgi:hypothetical protein
MYKEGGLATDGMDIDPVSGNEIPAGSNAVDVRDDVDAKLSEGEYVVPADVVKYFGVSYFEKLRNKAKEGLEEMQEDGRVGGDPVEEDMKEMKEEYTLGGDLASLDGYATGGLVEGMDVDGIIDRVKAAAAQDPSITNMLKAKGIFVQEPQPQGVQQQQAMSEGMTPTQAAPPVIQGQDTPTAFAEGGMVYGSGDYSPQQYASSFDPYAHTPGFSIESGVTGQAPGTDSVTPQCPTGYRWDATTQSCVPVSTSRFGGGGGGLGAPTQQRSGQDHAPAAGGNPNAWMEKYDYTSPENLFEQSMEKLGIRKEGAEEEEKSFLGSLGDAAKGLLGTSIAGGLVGKFVATTNAAQTAANALILRDMGRDDLADQLDAQNAAYVEESGIGRVPEFMRDGDRLANSVRDVKGDQWSTDATQRAETSTSSTSPAPSRTTSNVQQQRASSNNDKDSRVNAASQAASDYKARSDAAGGSVHDYAQATKAPQRASNTGSGSSGTAMRNDSVSASDANDPRNMSKGGLVQPRGKAKAKPVAKGKRGLAVKK